MRKQSKFKTESQFNHYRFRNTSITNINKVKFGTSSNKQLEIQFVLSLNNCNGNYALIKGCIGKTAHIKSVWTNGIVGEGNVSVFTLTSRPGTYIMDDRGLHYIAKSFNDVYVGMHGNAWGKAGAFSKRLVESVLLN